MHDREDQQRNRERHVHVQPRLENVLVALLKDQSQQQLFALTRDHEHLAQVILFFFRHEAEERGPIARCLRLAAAHAREKQSPSGQPPWRRLAHQLDVDPLKGRRLIGSETRHLASELIELIRDFVDGEIALHFRQ